MSRNLLDQIVAILPFKLTRDQRISIDEIINDLESSRPMSRLLQGDVGSGKTLVACLSSIPLIEAGYQVAFMVPTDLLARQHYNNLASILSNFNVSIVLLTGGLRKKEREDILEKIRSGAASLVVGTHAIFFSRNNI